MNSIFGTALEYPEARIEAKEGFHVSVQQNQSVSEALELLLTSGKDFIAVVDSFGRFQGTITRTILLDKLLLSLDSSLPREE